MCGNTIIYKKIDYVLQSPLNLNARTQYVLHTETYPYGIYLNRKIERL